MFLKRHNTLHFMGARWFNRNWGEKYKLNLLRAGGANLTTSYPPRGGATFVRWLFASDHGGTACVAGTAEFQSQFPSSAEVDMIELMTEFYCEIASHSY